jgi:hypothetical protein
MISPSTVFHFQEVPTQHSFNFVHNYNATLNFLDYELGKVINLLSGKTECFSTITSAELSAILSVFGLQLKIF